MMDKVKCTKDQPQCQRHRNGTCTAFKKCKYQSSFTNADHIRSMSDEELCDLLDEWWCMGSNNDERLAYADERLAWLQQSAAEEKEGADHA